MTAAESGNVICFLQAERCGTSIHQRPCQLRRCRLAVGSRNGQNFEPGEPVRKLHFTHHGNPARARIPHELADGGTRGLGITRAAFLRARRLCPPHSTKMPRSSKARRQGFPLLLALNLPKTKGSAPREAADGPGQAPSGPSPQWVTFSPRTSTISPQFQCAQTHQRKNESYDPKTNSDFGLGPASQFSKW